MLQGNQFGFNSVEFPPLPSMASGSMEARLSTLENLSISHSSQIEYLNAITKPAMKWDILLTAAEVLKWSIGKKGQKGGESYQFKTKAVRVLMKVWND